jgi:hypothetical protein
MNLRAPGDLKVVPSILVHAAWREFMLDPGSYSAFCASAIGYDLLSVPALEAIAGEAPTRPYALRKAYEAGLMIEGSKARDRIPLIFEWISKPASRTRCGGSGVTRTGITPHALLESGGSVHTMSCTPDAG